jgi:glycosyltransferase involved in cell wall biosynthesis
VRVLLINQVFHPDPQATSHYLSRLAQELVRRGHDVTVLTGRRDYDDPAKLYPARETWRGVEIIRVWNTGLGHGSKAGRMIDFISFLLLSTVRSLFLPRANVVVALTTPPLISVLGAALSLLWRARFVCWMMDLNPDEAIAMGWLAADSPVAHFLEAASKWSLNWAARVIVPDIYMRDRVAALGVASEKLEVIPLWADKEVTFNPVDRERFRKKHGIETKYVVMYAGNHTPCHPLDTLVDAAVLLRDDPRIHFCFVGGGMDWGRLRDRAQMENWKNVTFLGYQPEAELSGLLSAADMQVVVMGEPFVGIVHPCKVYNFLAAERSFISIGPERSHITDLVRTAGLEHLTISLRHGEGGKLVAALGRRAGGGPESPAWPDQERLSPWSEKVLLGKIISVVGD